MCGIVGILGKNEVSPLILECLKRLEYRGYDSAGIATVQNGKLTRRRSLGKLINLSDLLVHNPLSGKVGIGHTRWATHGAPSVVNAHPHQSGTSVSVVHNGIIENYLDLKKLLLSEGVEFESETDTETVSQLANKFLKDGEMPIDAVNKTLALIKGAFALCFLFSGEEDLIIAARQGSPLAIGHGDGEMYIGSDAIALAHLTTKITYLEEGDRAVVSRENLEITDMNGRVVKRKMKTIEPESATLSKNGYQHFMAKEIAEQPEVLSRILNNYISPDGTSISIPTESIDFSKINRITMVACGTAYLACLTAKYWFEKISNIPVDVDVASEFRYREPPLEKSTLAIFVSQSGETADTLAALKYIKGKATKIVSIVNALESSIARESDLALSILAGPEISVASTKGFTSQLTVLAILALKAGFEKTHLTQKCLSEHISYLRNLPELQKDILNKTVGIKKVSQKLAKARDVLFLGRGAMYPIALEGALKLKEISYIHAEGYASGELKHGPIALVEASVPVIVLAPTDFLFDKTISNMQEVIARNGKVLLISDSDGIEKTSKDTWEVLEMPKIDNMFAPIIYSIPIQLIAYYTALAKGTDVDQPRNLAKSVTVE
ncbi:MAG: glutamine--fructose-6-phosphate transaminase (isomerizing) [Proteobacteria bacterium]|jgi:glucosamine--fructose-6-phosphate aminotransferase (isomerizing)|nr:glutamine--fructose-6-phosphate transaminase (isomerizing) [Pseudomonadota bacterium]MDA1239111.1 glutamine--fructose-6-phosphate transaminase (isomerizing) [Pseudomonadota bacterium]